MINLIKADLYRLFRSKEYKISAIATAGIITFILLMSIISNAELSIMSYGVYSGFFIGVFKGADFNQFIINALASGAGVYIVAISLTSASVISRTKSGIMKNTVPYGYERWRIYVSQLIALIIGISIFIATAFILLLVATTIILKPTNVSYPGIFLAIKALILYIIIVSSTISIYLLLATIVSNSEVISAIAMVEIIGISMATHLIPMEVSKFIPYCMIRTLAGQPAAVPFTSYLLGGLLVIGVVTFLGILVFNKKEIK